jgi:hypothetical protein
MICRFYFTGSNTVHVPCRTKYDTGTDTYRSGDPSYASNTGKCLRYVYTATDTVSCSENTLTINWQKMSS